MEKNRGRGVALDGGTISSDWNNPVNWSPHVVPRLMQDFTIPDVVAPNHDPVVNITGLGCKDLTSMPGANFIEPERNKFKTKGN